MYKKKAVQSLGPNQRTASAIRKKVLTSPSSPKSGTQVAGPGGVKLKICIGDHFVSQNDDFTRGWTSIITHRGMLRTDPPNGGKRCPRLRLI